MLQRLARPGGAGVGQVRWAGPLKSAAQAEDATTRRPSSSHTIVFQASSASPHDGRPCFPGAIHIPGGPERVLLSLVGPAMMLSEA